MKTIGKWWKTIGKPWENCGKTIGKWWFIMVDVGFDGTLYPLVMTNSELENHH